MVSYLLFIQNRWRDPPVKGVATAARIKVAARSDPDPKSCRVVGSRSEVVEVDGGSGQPRSEVEGGCDGGAARRRNWRWKSKRRRRGEGRRKEGEGRGGSWGIWGGGGRRGRGRRGGGGGDGDV